MKRDWKKGVQTAFFHLPLVIPIKNTVATFRFIGIEYNDPMPASSLARIEHLKMVAGKLSQTEAFMVSAIIQFWLVGWSF